MKRVRVSNVGILLDVSDNYDKQEIQECFDLLNLDLSRNVSVPGQILGVNDIQDCDVEELEHIEDS